MCFFKILKFQKVSTIFGPQVFYRSEQLSQKELFDWSTLNPQKNSKMAANGPKMAETFWNSRFLKKHTILPTYEKDNSIGAKMKKWEPIPGRQAQKIPPLFWWTNNFFT